MDRRAWRATVRGVAESQTRLSDRAHMCMCLPRICISAPAVKADLVSQTQIYKVKGPPKS